MRTIIQMPYALRLTTHHKWDPAPGYIKRISEGKKEEDRNIFIPIWEHWPLECMISLNYFGGYSASQHPSKQAEFIINQYLLECMQRIFLFLSHIKQSYNTYLSMCCRIQPIQWSIFWSWWRSVFQVMANPGWTKLL